MQVLADTSVWVAHFRSANPVLQSLVELDQVLCNPLVVLEIACGTPPAPRKQTLALLKGLQQSLVATTDEILRLIEREKLNGRGCGAVDVALLASALLTPDTLLWTADKKLEALAIGLSRAFAAAQH